MGMARTLRCGVAGLAVPGVVWAAPAVLRARRFRLAVWPRLAGVGRPEHVALTFDDGPDSSGTPAVLDELEVLGWRATFFMLGKQVELHPDVAQEVADRGHEVAVHGFTHGNHLARTPRAVRDDIRRGVSAVVEATGQTPAWYRPPYGVLTAASLSGAVAAGLTPVLWTAWGCDWLARSASEIVHTVAGQLRPGGTVLLHDSSCTARVADSWRSTAVALRGLADLASSLGCQVGPLGEHFEPDEAAPPKVDHM
jgi:peptidoglycan/xylan/chitin deacetylase (PgdA/CDA1 family)